MNLYFAVLVWAGYTMFKKTYQCDSHRLNGRLLPLMQNSGVLLRAGSAFGVVKQVVKAWEAMVKRPGGCEGCRHGRPIWPCRSFWCSPQAVDFGLTYRASDSFPTHAIQHPLCSSSVPYYPQESALLIPLRKWPKSQLSRASQVPTQSTSLPGIQLPASGSTNGSTLGLTSPTTILK